jgi:zeaxanthin glucosyltransferase
METSRPLTILFAMLSETGHYNSSFRLARSLKARGHHIVYTGLADFAQLVKVQGFDFVPFAADLLPVGYLKKFADSQSNPEKGLLRKWRKRQVDEILFKEYLRRIEDGHLDKCLLSCKPDLLLCDTFLWYVALRALHVGIPTINIVTNLALYRNPCIPPVVSSFFPHRKMMSSVRVLADWDWMRFKYFFTKKMAAVLFGSYRFPTRMHHLMDEFLHIARHSGYPCQENKTYWFGEMGPRLILPEIVLYPKVFQLPGSAADGKMYLSTFIDFARNEEPLDAGGMDKSKPLVYCSLGTAAFFYPYSQRFFAAVVGASRLRRDWQFVLHVGDQYEKDQLGASEPNLLVRKRVPQLSLLKKASVMVTHGGFNSIMECIHFGVPMVIFPGLRDQPGAAVRAVHNGIALTEKMSRVTEERLVTLVSRAMEDDGLRRSLKEMKERIADEKDLETIIRFIETTNKA